MHPSFKNGDIVRVYKVDLNSINIGDVIVYREFETHLTIHRVVNIIKIDESNIKFVTKGDNRDDIDNYNVDIHNILGIVVKE